MLCERSVFWSATLAPLYFGLSVSCALRHSRKAELPESVAKTTCEPSCPTFPGILKRSPAPEAPCDPRRLEPQLPRPPCAATSPRVALAPALPARRARPPRLPRAPRPPPRAAPASAAYRAQRTNARPKARATTTPPPHNAKRAPDGKPSGALQPFAPSAQAP